jgi:small nuclear ribonucleoprotein (snRNP)-like protein
MLLNVVKKGEIVSCRLSTGEELVGTLREEDKNEITV